MGGAVGKSCMRRVYRRKRAISALIRSNNCKMEHPAGRILAVLELLQTYDRVSGPELAARLEVDRRTVRHYVATLHDLGIPVVSDRGRAGGYRLRPGSKLPPPMLSCDEALAVTLGLPAGA